MKLRFLVILMCAVFTAFYCLEKTEVSEAQEVYPGEDGDFRICKIFLKKVITAEKYDVMDKEYRSDEYARIWIGPQDYNDKIGIISHCYNKEWKQMTVGSGRGKFKKRLIDAGILRIGVIIRGRDRGKWVLYLNELSLSRFLKEAKRDIRCRLKRVSAVNPRRGEPPEPPPGEVPPRLYQYKEIRGYGVPGHHLGSGKVIQPASREDCKRICDSKPLCKSFDYGKYYGGGKGGCVLNNCANSTDPDECKLRQNDGFDYYEKQM